MAFKMQAGPEGPMEKNFGGAFKHTASCGRPHKWYPGVHIGTKTKSCSKRKTKKKKKNNDRQIFNQF